MVLPFALPYPFNAPESKYAMDSNVIIRLDDRLIHGQVVIGWGSVYPFSQIIVANDEIAVNDWEKDLLLLAAPNSVNAEVLTLEHAVQRLPELFDAEGYSIVLLNSLNDVKTLCNEVPAIKKINVGGLHFAPDKSEILRYLFINHAEKEIFLELMNRGIIFECQDVPNGKAQNLADLLEVI